MWPHAPGEPIAFLKVFMAHFYTPMTLYGPACTTILTIGTQDQPAHPGRDQYGSLLQHRNSRGAAKVDIRRKTWLETQMLRHHLTVHIGHVHIEVAREHAVNSRRR